MLEWKTISQTERKKEIVLILKTYYYYTIAANASFETYTPLYMSPPLSLDTYLEKKG